MSKTIYLIGSLGNMEIPVIGNKIRNNTEHEVFDDWWSASEDADSWLQRYYRERGFSHKQMLHSYASKHVFAFDYHHLNRCDLGVLVMPAGKSGHLELGYIIGKGKPGYILFDQEPERYDQMHQFATDVFYSVEDLIEHLQVVYSGT